MTVDKVIAKIIWLTFFGPPCMCQKLWKFVGYRQSCHIATI